MRSSIHEDFVYVKTLMGLEPFEVRFYFRQKFTKIDLALKQVIKNRSKVTQRLFVMFETLWKNNFLVPKVIWEHYLNNFFRTQKTKFSSRFGHIWFYNSKRSLVQSSPGSLGGGSPPQRVDPLPSWLVRWRQSKKVASIWLKISKQVAYG